MKQKSIVLVILMALFSGLAVDALAHPLGQLSINHYVRLSMLNGGAGNESGTSRVEIRYVVDLAELPTFREAQLADADSNGEVSPAEMEAYLASVTGTYLGGLVLSSAGQPLPLTLTGQRGEILPGQTGSAAMGLATMRLVFDLWTPFDWAAGPRQLRLENRSFNDKPGWREMVVTAGDGLVIYNSTIAGNSLTDELRAYPESMLTTPLDERSGEWTVGSGRLPVGARPLTLRDGQPAGPPPDRFLALITVPRLTPLVVVMGLLIAFGLGAIHALSPGHGKALVGAYLVGARGTTRHAMLLGLTVTIAHTLTVYLGGLAFLLASKYILPEQLYPILSFISGAMIMVIGAGLLLRRLSWSRALIGHQLQHLLHDHDHAAGDHHHLPDGDEKLSTRSLLRLGISGGIIPCPSAWILLLGAISLNRTAYGLVLILAFSLGLAAVLTVIGILFVQGGRLLERIPQSGGLLRILPILSAAVITI
ncbi:MAG: nickel/cobalt transporter, partial [Acidobacteriota bacterium]